MRLWIVFLVVALSASHAAGTAESTLRIAALVDNTAGIPAGTLRSGEFLASHLLSRASIRLVWSPSPLDGEEISKFRIHLLGGKPASPMSADAAGFAILFPAEGGTDGYAGIFYKRISDIASQEAVPESVVLGVTLAHEVVHLLLGSGSHNVVGIMQPRLRRTDWSAAARGELRFSSGECQAIAAEVRRRGR